MDHQLMVVVHGDIESLVEFQNSLIDAKVKGTDLKKLEIRPVKEDVDTKQMDGKNWR